MVFQGLRVSLVTRIGLGGGEASGRDRAVESTMLEADPAQPSSHLLDPLSLPGLMLEGFLLPLGLNQATFCYPGQRLGRPGGRGLRAPVLKN